MTIKTISVTPTVSTSPAYSAGDLVGGKLTFSGVCSDAVGRKSGKVIHAVLTDLAKQSIETDLILFDADPSGTTFTDNAAFDIADADLPKVIGSLSIATYIALNDNSFGQSTVREIPFALPSGNDLYGALVTRGTPTYATTGDVTIQIGVDTP